jgi:D-alanyl-D-alanine carboxypeptidase
VSSIGRRVTLVTAAVAGVGVGVAATLAFTGPEGPEPASSSPVTVSSSITTTTARSVPTPSPDPVLLIWTSGGLPPGLAAEVAALAGVGEVTVVRGDQAAMVASSIDGRVVEEHRDGWRIPLDTLAVEPATFASFVAEPAARPVRDLQAGEALLTQTSAELRGLSVGSRIELDGGGVTISGIIDDLSGAGAELIVTADQAAALGIRTERYLLVRHTAPRSELERTIAERFLGGRAVRFRTPAETTWLRHGDAVEPNLFLKVAFGEFAFRDRGGRDVEISPDWVDRWIVTDQVPILGSVTCHRQVIEPLRAALRELSDAGLGHLVDPADFAGCFGPRRIASGQPLSHHAWGAALDLNVDGNPRGSFSTQDERLVDVMAHHGFTWGGAWLVPDPAHYEAPLPAG